MPVSRLPLAEHIIDMNKEKNAEIKSYPGFLEGETGADVGDMANKTAGGSTTTMSSKSLSTYWSRTGRSLGMDTSPGIRPITGIFRNGMRIR
jgi:hypothetical protein